MNDALQMLIEQNVPNWITLSIQIYTLCFFLLFAYTDYKERKIYNKHILPWLIGVVAYFVVICVKVIPIVFRTSWTYGLFILSTPILVWIIFALFLFNKNKIGGGDVKVVFLTSFICLGWDFYVWLGISCFASIFVHLILAKINHVSIKTATSPFGVSMCLAWIYYILQYQCII